VARQYGEARNSDATIMYTENSISQYVDAPIAR